MAFNFNWLRVTFTKGMFVCFLAASPLGLLSELELYTRIMWRLIAQR